MLLLILDAPPYPLKPLVLFHNYGKLMQVSFNRHVYLMIRPMIFGGLPTNNIASFYFKHSLLVLFRVRLCQCSWLQVSPKLARGCFGCKWTCGKIETKGWLCGCRWKPCHWVVSWPRSAHIRLYSSYWLSFQICYSWYNYWTIHEGPYLLRLSGTTFGKYSQYAS